MGTECEAFFCSLVEFRQKSLLNNFSLNIFSIAKSPITTGNEVDPFRKILLLAVTDVTYSVKRFWTFMD